MDFSIIIPTLNEAQNIVNCLLPLQEFRDNCELIVVDGGSVDTTVKLAKPLANSVISSQPGRALQMNAGADIATGKVLIFLHADTRLPSDFLKAINQALTNYKVWGRFDVKLSGKHLLLPVIALCMNWRSRLTGIATGDQVIFVEKTMFVNCGKYPEIALMEDIAFCKNLKAIAPPACLKDKVITSGRRWEQFGMIKTMLLMWSIRLRYYLGADPAELAVLYRMGQFWKT